MNGYTKLFGSIVASTIWRESKETKIVWITMLALSNKYGVVEASLPGLADLARVSLEDTKTAIEVLLSPDSFSRTKDFEGRRIEEVDGGWAILNHGKYRAKMSIDERREYNRIKQAEWRARQNPSTLCQQKSITVNHSQSQSAMSAHAESREQRADTANTPIQQPEATLPFGEGVEKVEPSRSRLKTDLQRRCEKLFHMRETTAWDRSVKTAWLGARSAVESTAEEDWKLLEWFYSIPKGEDRVKYRRKELCTLLNNWNAEITKAQEAKEGSARGLGRGHQPENMPVYREGVDPLFGATRVPSIPAGGVP